MLALLTTAATGAWADEVVTAETTTFSDGVTYRVESDVTISSRITVSGSATLLLKDGYTLTAEKGIELSADNNEASLTINGEAENSGKLICTGDGDNAGIGAYHYGYLTINGGTVVATGGNRSAGIGGSIHNNWGRTITINGGIVNATGNDGGAGIGGGNGRDWHGGYGLAGDIIINGGQVTATGGGTDGPGIGPGYDYDASPSGSLTINLSAGTDDFVRAIGGSDNYGIPDLLKTFTITEGKGLVVDGIGAATAKSVKHVRDLYLRPATAEQLVNMTYAAVSGVEDSYYFTNADIDITPVVTDANGTALTEGTDYTKALTLGGSEATKVNTPGDYTLTFTGMGSYSGTYVVNFTVYIPTPDGFKQTAYAAEGATMDWSQTGNSASWVIEYSTKSDFSSDVTTVSDITDTSRELTGLDKETTYYARVKAVLGDYSSPWSSTALFYTTEKKWIGFGATVTTAAVPTYYSFNYSLTEQIYTQAELGIAQATIASIDFCNTGSTVKHNIDIYMVHTDKEKFSGDADWIQVSESDRVFSGNVEFIGGSDWTTVTLDKPFWYNGSQNVAIIIDCNDGESLGVHYFKAMNDKSYSSLNYYSDSTNPDPTGSVPDGSWSYSRNQIRLGFADYIMLRDDASNAAMIEHYNGQQTDVVLGRTLQAGGWNTFCAPFSVATPTGWTVKTLSDSSLDSETGTLTLTFADAASIEAGKPYLVKVTSAVANPVFESVTITGSTTTTETTCADFVPVMSPTTLTGGDHSVLFVTGGNKLTYPTADGNINAFRAYFHLKGDAPVKARAFSLNLGDGTTAITTVLGNEPTMARGTYTLDGRRIDGQPTQRGVYIVNGKKTVVK